MGLVLNSKERCFDYVAKILKNIPRGWLEMTTHRLDIYDEDRAKTQFLVELQKRVVSGDVSEESLSQLPTAFDYIRLGHQLSCLLEWILGETNEVTSEQVITFDSCTMPLQSVMRGDARQSKKTHVYYQESSNRALELLQEDTLRNVYLYRAELHRIKDNGEILDHDDGTVVLLTESSYSDKIAINDNVDITVNIHPHWGSALIVHDSKKNAALGIDSIVSAIQHVRRRETIAVTPLNAFNLLHEMTGDAPKPLSEDPAQDIKKISDCIQENSGSTLAPAIASSGLSVQYAILMGFIDKARTEHPDRKVVIMLPPNCYGGTNDQARRIAEINPCVEIMDLPVDGDQDMVSSLDEALKAVATSDSIGIVMAEIPTNPRVEVPDMEELGNILRAKRETGSGSTALPVVFVVDQTFCPNVKLLHTGSPLREVQVLSFASCSKFPSGGHCTGGYVIGNDDAGELLGFITRHLILCGNGATRQQLMILANNMPSMIDRIEAAYRNTEKFVNHVRSLLPDARLNFVSDEVAAQGFTPSVFSLELPTKGSTPEDRENYRRELNIKLIQYMIEENPNDCKHCVSYGQFKGTYWTIPATSTQGTTQETDKDYIVRVALSPDVNMDGITKAFSDFCNREIT